MPGLCFLAAKATAHAAALHGDGVGANAQRVCHPFLHFPGVLGAGVHQPLVLFLRNDVGDLSFQVKVLLAAHFQRALQAVGGAGQPGISIAAAHMHGRQHKVLLGNGRGGVQHGWQRCDVGLDFARRTACSHDAVCHHQPHDLANVPDFVQRKNGFVVAKGGKDGVARNVGRQHHAVHAGHGQRSAAIHAVQGAVGHGGQNGRGVQRAAQLGHIVQVGRSAQDLCLGAFVEVGLAHHAGGDGVLGGAFHTVTSTRMSCSDAPTCPWLSSQKRCIKLPSRCLR